MSARRGVFVVVVLLALLGASVFFAALVLRGPGSSAPDSALLVMKVPVEIDEAEPPSGSLAASYFIAERPTVWEYIAGLRAAAHDDRIEALVLHIDGMDWGWGKVAEIRDAVLEFRATGKPVYASISGGGEREYLLASAADVVAAPPLAILRLDGLAASALFLRGTLDKLDIRPNFAQAGQYKSGAEGFTRSGMSEPVRKALEEMVADEYAVLVDSIGTARGLAADSVSRLLDRGPFISPTARDAGLIDTVLYRADLDSLAARDGDGPRESITFKDYLEARDDREHGPRIALVLASGTMAEGKSRSGAGDGLILGSETLIKAMEEVRERSTVKAVVLRIDSPGGTVQSADEMWHAVARCALTKPVIVSMGDVAASGGYYIAAAADSIVAQPSTITGSIGVYAGKLNVLGLYRKLGLNVETVSKGRHAEMLSPYRDFDADESARFQAEMERIYETFLDRVVTGRGLSRDAAHEVGQGRVWTGIAALERGLVDELGGLPRAVEIAKARAGIDPDESVNVVVYPKVERSFIQRLFASLFGEEEEALSALRLPPAIRSLLDLAELPAGAVLALMPYTIEIR